MIITLPQIKGLAQAAAQSAVRVAAIQNVNELTTLDATPVNYDIEMPVDAGFVRVIVVAADTTGKRVAGVKEVSYEYGAGAVVIGVVVSSFPTQTTITGADFAISASGIYLRVTVTGVLNTEIKWRIRHEIDFVIKPVSQV